ncbi:hypothetical protein BC826DRAFT_1091661 [Russula brevipes]|nr:hypothetical protein BC826DRAFT_1091661 [Russula brevipes]
MVNQSDTPFRALVHKHGATLTYTEMLRPARLLSDADYLAFHRRALESGRSSTGPVVVQVCGNDQDVIVRGAKTVVDLCDGIDLNLGCPQDIAREEHFGAYLLGKKDWPLVQGIVSSLSHSLCVPVSAKLRLCSPVSSTLTLASNLQASGAAFLALHARHPSALKALVEGVDIPVISNGNDYTGARGVMVGETLLGNPYLFEGTLPDPVATSLEYLELCRMYPDTATLKTIQTHIRHFIEHQCLRRPWFTQFRIQLGQCVSLDEIEVLLQVKVRRWRGLTDQTLDLTGFLDEDGLSDGHSTLLLDSRSPESSG